MTDLIARIQSIGAKLIEVRRHVTADPDLVTNDLIRLADTLHVLFDDSPEVDVSMSILTDRLAANLTVASRDILSCPDMTRGYIDGVLWELARLIGTLERELERGGERDRDFDADIAGAVTA